MEFVRQYIQGEPTPADVVAGLYKADGFYADKIKAMTRLYNNCADRETLFSLYKRGLDTERIEKLRFPIARYITTILANYMLGEPPRYSAVPDAPAETDGVLQSTTRLYGRQSKGRLDKELKRQCGKTGFAYELVFYDAESLTPKSVQLPVESTFVSFDYGIERNSLYAAHYVRKDKKTYAVYVYTPELVIEYETRSIRNSADWHEVGRTPHYMGRVPVTMYLNNGDGRGDYEDVAPLIDALNGIATDERFDIKRTVDALLVFVNTKLAGATPEEKTKVRDAMRELGILEINDDEAYPNNKADVRTLSNPLNITSTEVFIDRIWKAIFRLSGVPDPTQTEYFTALSGVALKMQLFLGLEPFTRDSEGEFDYALKRRLKMYNHFSGLRGQESEIDVGDVLIEFRHTAPGNDLETAQIVSMLYGKPLVSNETLTKQFSFVDDAQAENAAAASESANTATDTLLAQLAGYDAAGGTS